MHTGLLKYNYVSAADVLEGLCLFFMLLAAVVTFLDMGKELAKKYHWQRSLHVYIKKAVLRHDTEVSFWDGLQDVDVDKIAKELSAAGSSSGGMAMAMLRQVSSVGRVAAPQDVAVSSDLSTAIAAAGLMSKVGTRGKIKLESLTKSFSAPKVGLFMDKCPYSFGSGNI